MTNKEKIEKLKQVAAQIDSELSGYEMDLFENKCYELRENLKTKKAQNHASTQDKQIL